MTPWTAARQAPLFMESSRQGYWSGLPFPSPGGLPDLGIKPRSPALGSPWLPLTVSATAGAECGPQTLQPLPPGAGAWLLARCGGLHPLTTECKDNTVVQWLRLHTPNAPRFEPWSGNYILHAAMKILHAKSKTGCSQKKKKNQEVTLTPHS